MTDLHKFIYIDKVELQPMDEVYTRSPGWFWDLAAHITREKGEGPVLATHQGKMYDGKHICQALGMRGVVLEPISDALKRWSDDGTKICILRRNQRWTEHEESLGQYHMLRMRNWKYSHLELPLQLMDGLIAKATGKKRGLDAIYFRRLGNIWEKGVICSKTANFINIKLGDMPEEYQYGVPDDSYDYQITHNWRIVYASEDWQQVAA